MNAVSEYPRKVNQVKLESKVKAMYKEVANHPEIEYHFEMGRGLAERLGYPKEMLDKIPKEAIDSFAGVGYHFDLAKIKKGEIVLDLGSGSGMDVFFAAQQAGLRGETIGIDMTEAQLEKSMNLRAENNLDAIVFQEGYIEEPPIINECIDVVISNGVINLSSNKELVFQNINRVLQPGGRMVISDIVSSVVLPESISCNSTLWAACIGGAMQFDQYLDLIRSTGFEIEEVKVNPYAFISNSAQGATQDYGIKSISLVARKIA